MREALTDETVPAVNVLPTTTARTENAPVPAAGSSHRIGWIDTWKGILIILVVLGHVIGGLRASGILADDWASHFAYAWIYAFHMPAFFLVSGLLVRRSRERGLVPFVKNKVATLLYPYLLWGLIVWTCHWTMRQYTNTIPDPLAPLKLVYAPGHGSWFLYALFLLCCIYGIIASFRHADLVLFLVSLGVLIADSLGWLSCWSALDYVGPNMIYFALGVVLSERIMGWASDGRSLVLGVLVAACLAGMSVLVAHYLAVRPVGVRTLAALLGIIGSAGVAVLLARGLRVPLLANCGKHSLEIYLVHPLSSVLPRVLLLRGLRVDSPWLHLPLGVGLGVLVPLVLAWTCQRFRVPFLFRWPSSSKGRE
jgi:fucose 4-O-acetylase-like acetyltransferase